MSDCLQSLEHNDRYIKSLMRLGVAYRRLNNLKQSISFLKRAKEIDAKDSSVETELARTAKLIEKRRLEFKQKMVRSQRISMFEAQIAAVRDVDSSVSIL